MENILEKYEVLINKVQEMLGTSTAVMAPYPVTPVGQPKGYEKQSNGKQKNGMYKYKYRKTRSTGEKPVITETMKEIRDLCNAIIEDCNKLNSAQALRKFMASYADLREKSIENSKKSDKDSSKRLKLASDNVENAAKEVKIANTSPTSEGHEYNSEYRRDPARNIQKGSMKREQNRMNKWNEQAGEANPELIANQKSNIRKFVQLMKKRNADLKAGVKRGSLNDEELEALQNMKGSAPGANYEPTKTKYENAQARKNKFSEMAKKSKSKYKKE